MSNHNYKQYYNKNNSNRPNNPNGGQKPVVKREPEAPVTPVVEAPEIPVIVDPVIPVVEPDIVQPAAPAPITGKVVNCKMLNIRVAPRKFADVITVVKEGVELVIDMDRSVEDWYSVCTAAGVEGYCIKEFIEL